MQALMKVEINGYFKLTIKLEINGLLSVQLTYRDFI